jgi:signal transduction histidine kinase
MYIVNARPTDVLTAERYSRESVERQARIFAAGPAAPLLERLPSSVVVFNAARQIVFANEQFRRLVPDGEAERDVLGLRLGEALTCLGVNPDEGGCGMSAVCRHCGAGQSMAALASGREVAEGECRLALGDGQAGSLDFHMRVWAMPQDGELFHAAVLIDTRAEKRLALMERIFYHDILNYVSGMRGVCELFRHNKTGGENGELELLAFAVDRIAELIESQRDFSRAERGDYAVTSVRMRTVDLLQELLALMRQESSCRGKNLVLDSRAADAILFSDRRLVSRVLVNMLKNALEATPRGETITAGCEEDGKHLRFWVRNPGRIPQDSQAQIFHRTFSTKGEGRGLGTYSMKLFAENYLEGRVGFITDETVGTEFFLRLPLALCCGE